MAFQIIILALIYFVFARAGLLLDPVSGFATLVWPPTGISLAALLLFGVRLWPGVALGAFFVNWVVGANVPVALGIATGNTLEAVVGAYALMHFVRFQMTLEKTSCVLKLIAVAAVFSTLLGATIGPLSLWAGGVISAPQYFPTWQAWWIGDMLGALVVTPLILTWSEWRQTSFNLAKIAEIFSLVVLLIFVSLFIFWNLFGIADHEPVGFLIFPCMIWAAFRFGVRGVTLATLLVSALAIAGTYQGFGPFAKVRASDSLLMLQLFMGVLATTSLLLASLMHERTAAAQREEKLKKDFFYTISHELKSPLAIIKGVVREMKDSSENRQEREEMIAMIDRNADWLTRLVNNLLDFSRLESEEIFSRFRRISIPSLLNQALKDFGETARERKVVVHVNVPSALPEIFGEPQLLGVVFANLLSNALRFAKSRVSVTAALRQELPRGTVLLVSVCDDGPGIPQEDLERVFEKFERISHPSPWKEYKGTGLGLAIAKKIVELHRGKIWAESFPGGETSFYVRLPV